MSAFPTWGGVILYYAALLLLYRYLIYGFMQDTIQRQLVGLRGTLALTAAISAYILALALPPFLLGRSAFYHAVWRGIECYLCYAVVALALGSILAAAGGDEWSAWSGLVAEGGYLAVAVSLVLLPLALVAAAGLGAKHAANRRSTSRRRRKE